MRIIIIGGTGFIGRALAGQLDKAGHWPVIISRNLVKARTIFGDKMEIRFWDGRSPEILTPLLEGADAIINLAGETIGIKLWTKRQKKKIMTSRVGLGSILVASMKGCENPPAVFIQGSAIGYYGPVTETACTEDHPRGAGFMAALTEAWELSIVPLSEHGIRLIYLRSGPVFGPRGEFLQRLHEPFRFGFGLVPGNGKNWLSWIQLEDEVAAIHFLLESESHSGPFNLVAPEPITMGDLVREMAQLLGRRLIFTVPEFILKLVMGEMAREVVLASQKIVPSRLLQAGFRFTYPSADKALRASLLNNYNKVQA